jgi:hypothetical protein
MAINLVVLDGMVQHVALRYDEHSRPELRFTLQQVDHATDGNAWTSYWPCCASGSAAERLASEIEDGQHIVVTSGKLVYRKRATKLGEQSRMEILVWTVDRLSSVDADNGSQSDEPDSTSQEVACNTEASEPVPGHKPRKRAIPKHLGREWQPEHAN